MVYELEDSSQGVRFEKDARRSRSTPKQGEEAIPRLAVLGFKSKESGLLASGYLRCKLATSADFKANCRASELSFAV